MTAQICSVIVNALQAFAGSKSGHKSFTPLDFLPDWAGERSSETEKPGQSVGEMKAALLEIAGSAKRKGKKEEAAPVPVKMKKRKAK